MDNSKLNYLNKCDENFAFRLSNGVAIYTLEQLLDEIKRSDDFFYAHVNDSKNDFVSWIRAVIGYVEFANKAMNIKNREEFILLLEKSINDIKTISITPVSVPLDSVVSSVVSSPVSVPLVSVSSTPLASVVPSVISSPVSSTPLDSVVPSVVSSPVSSTPLDSVVSSPVSVSSVPLASVASSSVSVPLASVSVVPSVVSSPVSSTPLDSVVSSPVSVSSVPLDSVVSSPVSVPLASVSVVPSVVSSPVSVPLDSVVPSVVSSPVSSTPAIATTSSNILISDVANFISEEIYDFEDIFSALIIELEKEVFYWDTAV
jgi:hypothetical protein